MRSESPTTVSCPGGAQGNSGCTVPPNEHGRRGGVCQRGTGGGGESAKGALWQTTMQ